MTTETMNDAVITDVAKEKPDVSVEDFIFHIPGLRRYARALVHNTADADDLVQDCLVRALSRVHLFQPGTHLRAWLLAILHNIFLDGTRAAKRTREFTKAITLMKEGAFTRPSQFHHIELLEIDKALAALPPEQRSTLLLVALEGLNYAETAKVTDVPVGTVRSRLSRGRSALTSMVKGVACGEPELAGQEDRPKGGERDIRAIQNGTQWSFRTRGPFPGGGLPRRLPA